MLPPFAQQRTAPPLLQHGPRLEIPQSGPAAQPAMLLHWKGTGQAGTAGAASKVI
jgi:hypothetical protein